MPRVWYLVRDFDRGRDFYKRLLGFDETYVDFDDKWSKLEHGKMLIALGEGDPVEAGVAIIDVADVRADAEGCAARVSKSASWSSSPGRCSSSTSTTRMETESSSPR